MAPLSVHRRAATRARHSFANYTAFFFSFLQTNSCECCGWEASETWAEPGRVQSGLMPSRLASVTSSAARGRSGEGLEGGQGGSAGWLISQEVKRARRLRLLRELSPLRRPINGHFCLETSPRGLLTAPIFRRFIFHRRCQGAMRSKECAVVISRKLENHILYCTVTSQRADVLGLNIEEAKEGAFTCCLRQAGDSVSFKITD